MHKGTNPNHYLLEFTMTGKNAGLGSTMSSVILTPEAVKIPKDPLGVTVGLCVG